MSTSTVYSSSINLNEISLVEVQVSLNNGLPFYNIVGLGDSAIKESRERVKFAIKNSGYVWPDRRITINLSPAWRSKKGSSFDLAIALGILQASKQLPQSYRFAAWGELSLDGSIESVPQALSLTHPFLDAECDYILVPEDAKLILEQYFNGLSFFNSLSDIKSYQFNNLFSDSIELDITEDTNIEIPDEFNIPIDLQEAAWRACQIAVAGGHNLLMLGSAGSGKTTLARASKYLLPKMNEIEKYNIALEHSSIGLNYEDVDIRRGIFREPHHSITKAAMIGSAYKYPLGELLLANNGILFLDEVALFRSEVLNQLSKIMEDGYIERYINGDFISFNSRFITIAASNPCACGELYEDDSKCECSDHVIKRYKDKFNTPLYDRFDLFLNVKRIDRDGLKDSISKFKYDLSEYNQKVQDARVIQDNRYKDINFNHKKLNAWVDIASFRDRLLIEDNAFNLFETLASNFTLSIRAYQSILRISRTIADLNKHEDIQEQDILEAFSYRRSK